jgi:isopentenyl diphosphate isomerase/L-lactate dehydrogenase-like FMN-dependent dehydrogenase
MAENSGFDGLVVTVDAQVLGTRRKELKYPLDSSTYRFPVIEEVLQTNGPKERKAYLKGRDLSLSWSTIDKLRTSTKLKIVLKGILHPDDAFIAVDHCDAIYVSNHGGRQLDTVPATIEILPRIVAAVRSRNKQIPILIDGGIRTGTDIFKCLALGASFAFIGRPIAYALVKGENGVNEVTQMLKDELMRCMILSGVRNVSDFTSEYVGYKSML